MVDQYLPQPRSGRGLTASRYVTPLPLTLYGGGETIEDVREIRDDQTLTTALDLKSIPSSSAIGDWLKLKELKGGVGMDRLPSGDFGANALHFAIGIMTYNLFLAQRLLTMPADWCTKTIKSIRWCLIEVGGKLIQHGRHLILKLATSVEKYRLYLEMRRRTYAVSSA